MEPTLFVSVVLPTFNRAATLRRSIASVLDQTHRDLELIVVDDGSSDGTEGVVSAIRDDRIRYLRLDANAGQAAARNAGIRASRADFVAFQDSDDIWQPDKLSRQVRILKGDPGLGGVYCDLDRHWLNGTRLLIEAPNLTIGKYLDDRSSLYQTYGLGIQSCVFRKQVLAGAGGFREDLRCFEDLELILRIAHRHRMQRIPEALVGYFESETSVSKNAADERQARLFLLSRYGVRALARHPMHVAVEALRCVMLVRHPRKILASLKQSLAGRFRRALQRTYHGGRMLIDRSRSALRKFFR